MAIHTMNIRGSQTDESWNCRGEFNSKLQDTQDKRSTGIWGGWEVEDVPDRSLRHYPSPALTYVMHTGFRRKYILMMLVMRNPQQGWKES